MKKPIVAATLAACLIAPSAFAQTPSVDLSRLFADERAYAYREEPLRATYDGVHDYDDHLASVTPADQTRRAAADADLLRRLQAIDRTALSHQEQISYDLFAFMIGERVRFAPYNEWRLPLNSDSGFYSEILQLHDTMQPRTVRDYENYIARLNDVPRYFREQSANMRQGVRDGFTLPAEIMTGLSSVIDGFAFGAPETTPFWMPFAQFPDSVSQSERARLTEAGRAAITNSVIPAFGEFRAFFQTEYAPRARRSIAASALPNGRTYYADLVRYFTTLPDATPRQVHQTGLREVARIRGEMEAIVREVGFQGSFNDFLISLRTDPQFYARTPEELLYRAAWITREIDGHLPDYFGHLPRTPYTVEPVPAAIAPNYTGGRYNPGPMGAAGTYWVNTYALNTRPLYVLPSLTAHEAAPGHHIQGAIARELTDMPTFRLTFYPHSFGEGWGLYSERLAGEMGIYHTPYERFGRLTYEMWRACRLVVDTGMHSMGWSRQRALDYMTANTALSEHEIRTEIDRYIGWPGQALAYKIGELTIVDLRERAQRELGDRFDIRDFHDAVLANGGVTMPVLSQEIDLYIERELTQER